jgi:K+-sensing histidine kinase KdpD
MTQTKPNRNLVTAGAICFVAILLTTSVLWTIDYFTPTRHLMLGYLLLTILIAMSFGGILALLTAFACALIAAYFLLPPKFSFYIDDPVQVAELVITIVLAIVAATGINALTHVTGGQTGYSSWWPP